jgi:WD40 repeat protein
MSTRRWFVALLVFCTVGTAFGQVRKLARGEKEPFLRVESGGHMAYVTAVAFAPDGKTLYSAGHDKVVRVWTLNDKGRFEPAPEAFRMPIGPGQEGIINALAVSPDGEWLAVGGMGAARDVAGFRQSGIVLPVTGAMTQDMWLDRGQIYLFNVRTGKVRLLREHEGAVVSLAFAPAFTGKAPLLVSAARERDTEIDKYKGLICVWDVQSGKMLDNRFLPDTRRRPGLAIRHTGPGLLDERLAIAWGDGFLRFWDLSQRNQPLLKIPDLRFNTAIAFVPGSDRFLTGGLYGHDGQLRWWDDVAGGPQRPEVRPLVFQPRNPDDYLLPQAFAFLPAGAAQPNLVAVVVGRATKVGGIEDYQLHVVDLNGGPTRVTRLWEGSDLPAPALAASPGDDFLAVAGDTQTHAVRVFQLPVAPGAKALQVLRGAGTDFGRVAFATNARKELGLILRPAAATGLTPPLRAVEETDLAFHFAERRLTPAPGNGWTITRPAPDGWTVDFSQRKEEGEGDDKKITVARFVVRHGDLEKEVILPAPEQVDGYALLPPARGIDTAVLAVASWDRTAFEPLLYLYRVDTGEPVRQFKGHVEHIRSLAFTPDGRLLASAAEDQTVAVWSLTNLDKVLNRRGLVRGLSVKEDKDNHTVFVSQVKADSPARGKVEEKDVVEALELPGQKKSLPIKQPMEFYLNVFHHSKPGDMVGVRVRGQGIVNLPVGQGIDERKPLFSLFVKSDRDGKPREWIGWSPVGPYDASGARAEEYLGWHFNTGDEERPTTFAPAGQYRKQYYKEGLLKYLVAQGDLAAALATRERELPPPPRPVMTPFIGEIGPAAPKDAQGRILVQRLPATLKLPVDNVDPDEIASVGWRFDGGGVQQFTSDDGSGEWTVDLSNQAWRRGPHQVDVVVELKHGDRKEFTGTLLLRYQPPPPLVRFTPAWFERTFGGDAPLPGCVEGQVLRLPQQAAAQLVLEGEVQPGADGENVRVTLTQAGKAPLTPPRRFRQALELQPGDNQIELRAANQGALAGFENAETTAWHLAVRYQPPRVVVPPEVVLNEVRPSSGDAVVVEPGRPAVVQRRVVRLVGRIKGAEELTEAKRDGKDLADFKGQSELRLNEEVTLKPGVNQVTLMARTEHSKPAETTLTIEYQPELPRLVVRRVAPPEVVEGRPRPELEIDADLAFPPDAAPAADCKATLLLGGKELPIPIQNQKLTIRHKLDGVELKPGDNVVQVRLSHRWNRSTTVDVLRLPWRRPPQIVAIERPEGADKGVQVDRPLVSIRARVESATDLPLTRAEVNERAAQVRRIDRDRGLWEVEATDVPLEEGDNNVTLQVWNPDGAALRPRVVKVNVKPARKVLPPVVRFTNPIGTSAIVPEPTFPVQFTVQSDESLKSIELRRGDEVLYRGDPAKLPKNALGLYEIPVRVRLKTGPNALDAIAVNEGGEGRAVPVTLSYTPQPVHFEFDKVVTADDPDKELAPEEKDKRLVFTRAPGDRVVVRGTIVWPDETDPRLNQAGEVRVWVNGFQQPPVKLQRRSDAKSRKREFEAEVVLNQTQKNRVEFELPGLAQEAGKRREFLIDCAKPRPPETWHVLVVGVGDKDQTQLKDRVLKAVRSQPGVRGAFQVRLYGPLTEDVSPETVYAQLRRIKKVIDTQAAQGSANDVLMVYYIGQEAVKSEGHFFTTDVSEAEPDLKRSGLSVQELRDSFLSNTLGARVVLLDVAREPTVQGAAAAVDRVAQWTDKDRVGILRYSYEGGRTPTIPPEARLLTAWNTFLDANRNPDRPVVLDDVGQAVAQDFVQTSQDPLPRSRKYTGLTLSENLPEGLRSLTVEHKTATKP